MAVAPILVEKNNPTIPQKLAGLGFRALHFQDLLANSRDFSWIEVISENYIDVAPERFQQVERLRQNYDVSLHGVSLNLASRDPLDFVYLKKLKELIAKIDPIRVSDHLCWTGNGGHNFHDLLPFPYTRQMLQYVGEKVQRVQDFLQREILIENLSSYLTFEESEMTEMAFLTELSQKTSSAILLDLNNLYVNSQNHQQALAPDLKLIENHIDRVQQIHLAGFIEGSFASENFLIDTHSRPVHADVWKVFSEFYQRHHQKHIPFCLEWDDDIPDFPTFFQEVKIAQSFLQDLYV
jgi:uncharacterized protein (UPF0276 family)